MIALECALAEMLNTRISNCYATRNKATKRKLTELRERRAVLQEANWERWNDNASRGKAIDPAKCST